MGENGVQSAPLPPFRWSGGGSFSSPAPLTSRVEVARRPNGHPQNLPMQVLLGGCAASLATIITNPLDVLRTRVQLGLPRTGIITTHEGRRSLLTQGLGSNVARSFSYSALCLVTSDWLLRSSARWFHAGKGVSFAERVAAGVSGGALAAFLSNPVEVMRVQLQANRDITAYGLYRSQGLSVFWQGSAAHMQRSAIWAGVLLSTYGSSKSWLLGQGWFSSSESSALHLCASCLSSVCTVSCAHPWEQVKVRLMAEASTSSSRPTSSSSLELVQEMWRSEGLKAFYRGSLITYLRSSCHAALMFVTLERLRRLCGQSEFLG